jgi:hypothetical protein
MFPEHMHVCTFLECVRIPKNIHILLLRGRHGLLCGGSGDVESVTS